MLSREEPKGTLSIVLQRGEVIDQLRDGPKDKRTLVERVNCSRSTVNRSVRELASAGFVTYDQGEYELTQVGELVTECTVRHLTEIQVVQKMVPFVRHLPMDDIDLDLQLLRDAELVVAEPGDPYAMINRHVDRLKEMDHGRFLLPYVGMHATEVAHKQVVDGGAECELVVHQSAAETFRSNPAYAPLVEEMIATGRFTVSVFDGEMPFSLGVVDDLVQIIADEEGEPRALVEAESKDVREWAEGVFDAYRRQATSFDLSETSIDDRSAVG